MSAAETFHLEPDFLAGAALARVFAALAPVGETQVVGGAVRNAILGEPVADVDLATTATPDRATQALERAGVRVIATGLAHGTVTAVADGEAFEVTTLRRDVLTDGRHAKVVFTEDWREDAARRDFTMNALFLAADGTGTDHVGGLADCKARRVRFIGDPRQRIAEDYLRILRLLRFHARYGRGCLDAPALEAAHELRSGLAHLSAERVEAELTKLLAAPGAPDMVDVLADGDFLAAFAPAPLDAAAFRRLREAETRLTRIPQPALGYAALAGYDAAAVCALAARLRLPHRERDRALAAIAAADRLPADAAAVRALVHTHGATAAGDGITLALARGRLAGDPHALHAEASRFTPPPFPLSGRDLLAAGAAPGPELGARLKRLEQLWIDSDFALTRDALLAAEQERP